MTPFTEFMPLTKQAGILNLKDLKLVAISLEIAQ
jgi:hypothetical protein